jgi:four helix bundle protein
VGCVDEHRGDLRGRAARVRQEEVDSDGGGGDGDSDGDSDGDGDSGGDSDSDGGGDSDSDSDGGGDSDSDGDSDGGGGGGAPFLGEGREEGMFGFQRLDAYRAASEFLAAAYKLTDETTRGHGDLADQLRRAALSIPLNIAEGSGKKGRDAARFHTIARASALECAAILDAFESMSLVSLATLSPHRQLLDRLVAMLTGLIRK